MNMIFQIESSLLHRWKDYGPLCALPPNRIDLIQTIEGLSFEEAWPKREMGAYGPVHANWIDLDSLIKIKERIDDPRHQADAKDLRKVRNRRSGQ